ncbi:hypothetical protein CBW56_11735 [Denitratisoma oestradiolicum]|nr:hypothetical protein CBW56_11735 [Denitratisoma oestradiolicum]
MVTGVLATFRLKVTVIPEGILTVPKLNTPEGGNWTSVFTVGEKSPSAPVLPLLKAQARAGANRVAIRVR